MGSPSVEPCLAINSFVLADSASTLCLFGGLAYFYVDENHCVGWLPRRSPENVDERPGGADDVIVLDCHAGRKVKPLFPEPVCHR